MRFLADMGIALDVVAALRERGHDAIHLRERQLHRLPDDEIVRFAETELRIILTHDLDFSRLFAITGASGPSLVTFRLNDMRPATVTARVLNAMEFFHEELQSGAAVSITDGAVRCRPLPIRSEP